MELKQLGEEKYNMLTNEEQYNEEELQDNF